MSWNILQLYNNIDNSELAQDLISVYISLIHSKLQFSLFFWQTSRRPFNYPKREGKSGQFYTLNHQANAHFAKKTRTYMPFAGTSPNENSHFSCDVRTISHKSLPLPRNRGR